MIWLNGEIVDDERLVSRASDRGLLLGDGLFETIKIRNGRPVFLGEHMTRLTRSADFFALPVDRRTLEAGLHVLLDRAGPGFSGSARLTVSRGPGPRGLAPIPIAQQCPVCFISLAQNRQYTVDDVGDVILSPFQRSSTAPSGRHKTLSYTDNLTARNAAFQQGAIDAIFGNERGEAASTTMANIFVDFGNAVLTPPLSAGILPGIVREKILSMARSRNLPIKERRIPLEDLSGRWIYRTNSLLGVDTVCLVGDDCPPEGLARPDLLADLLAEAEENEGDR
ncbi:MAG: aminotransferase class IV [Parvularcula sp.]